MAELSALAGPSPNWEAVLVQMLHWEKAVLLIMDKQRNATKNTQILRYI